jgi:hypothetical protein
MRQQSPQCIIAGETQPCIAIPLQQGRSAVGVRQASAGVAAQRTTIASNTNAPFLPTCIVYAIRRDHSEYRAQICAVIQITQGWSAFLHCLKRYIAITPFGRHVGN